MRAYLVGLAIALSACALAMPAALAADDAAPVLRIESGAHTAPIRAIATDAGGRFAVTASEDKTARVWDIASGRLQQVLRPPIGAANEGKLYAYPISRTQAPTATGARACLLRRPIWRKWAGPSRSKMASAASVLY